MTTSKKEVCEKMYYLLILYVVAYATLRKLLLTIFDLSHVYLNMQLHGDMIKAEVYDVRSIL